MVGTALGLAPDDLPDPGGPEIAMRLVPLPAGVATTQADGMALRLRISEELAAEVSVTDWRGRGFLRLSGQVYNRAEEYDGLAERLPRLLPTITGRR